jgi:hypothetical protein
MIPVPSGSNLVEWFGIAAFFFSTMTILVAVVSGYHRRRNSRRNTLSLRLKGGAVFKAEGLNQSEVEEIVAKFRDRMEAVHR